MYRSFILIILSLVGYATLVAQGTMEPVVEEPETGVYKENWQLDSANVGRLNLNINSTVFFRNNEISTPMMKGYTLPGFRLRPSVGYMPSKWVNVEVGLYMFRFWGTDHYPNFAYSDISIWKGEDFVTRGLHMLPFFRVQMATRDGWNFVLGSIYGGWRHKLLEPLYAPELTLIADPESGLQILYSNSWFDLDTWVNWESFIYKTDTHQEAFTFGISSRFKYNNESKPLHVYTPVQILFQHRGGEIDTIFTNSVQTLFNGAVGIGARFDINRRAIKRLTLEADLLAYNQQVGNLLPFDHGWAYYLHGHLDIANVNLKLGYCNSHKFVSLFGYPFFGGVSVSHDNLTIEDYSTLLAGIDYNHEISPGYTIGGNAVVFRHLSAMGQREGVPERFGASTSYCASLYCRINPSFLLKKFNIKRN